MYQTSKKGVNNQNYRDLAIKTALTTNFQLRVKYVFGPSSFSEIWN